MNEPVIRCPYCREEITGKEHVCPHCHKLLEVQDDNRKTIKIAIFVIVAAAFIIFCVSRMIKPMGLSDRDYKIAKEAVDICDDYLDDDLTKSEARSKLEALQDTTTESGGIMVSSYILSLRLDFMGSASKSVVKADRNKLASYVRYKVMPWQ